jgi:hypothetical protein
MTGDEHAPATQLEGNGRLHRRPRAVSHYVETETALSFLHCRIFGRKTGCHFS